MYLFLLIKCNGKISEVKSTSSSVVERSVRMGVAEFTNNMIQCMEASLGHHLFVAIGYTHIRRNKHT